MKDSQLKVNFNAIKSDMTCEEDKFMVVDDITEKNDEIVNEEQGALFCKKNLRALVLEVSKVEGMENSQISAEAFVKLQEIARFLTSMLIFETLDEVKKDGKKKIVVKHLDSALDNILNKSAAIDIVLEMLSKDIDELSKINNSRSVSKATKFINE
ncbi:hypothetical protein [Clostridium perfringens]|uniref:hypothetical protein n=1 Tax=Clostridium perfringens TaxID=1502 RepID=UPI002FCCD41A